jgi:hypothetical protein
VDGGHSEETIENDGQAVLMALGMNYVAVFDDYYHGEKPDGIGCNKFIDALDPLVFDVTHLPAITHTPTVEIGMVKVERKKHADISLQLREQSFCGDNPSYSGFVSLPDLYKVRQGDAPRTAVI